LGGEAFEAKEATLHIHDVAVGEIEGVFFAGQV
jgi:hypothetical protein